MFQVRPRGLGCRGAPGTTTRASVPGNRTPGTNGAFQAGLGTGQWDNRGPSSVACGPRHAGLEPEPGGGSAGNPISRDNRKSPPFGSRISSTRVQRPPQPQLHARGTALSVCAAVGTARCPHTTSTLQLGERRPTMAERRGANAFLLYR
jgi:hypothetical protein